MSQSQSHLQASSRNSPSRSILAMVLMAGFASSYWVNFIWFYLKIRWGTEPSTNLIFNGGFGLLYIIGCLITGRIGRKLGPRFMLIVGFSALIVLTAISSQINFALGIGAVILTHAFIVTWTWPNLEMLMASGLHGIQLNRAVSMYNLSWAGTSAFAAAIAGTLYNWNSLTLPGIPIFFWTLAAVLVARAVPSIPPVHEIHGLDEKEGRESIKVDPGFAQLMKRLSRGGNMGCYLLISTLVPVMPTITSSFGLDYARATAFASVWMAGRVLAFFVLGRWHGWHYRLPLFLVAMFSLPILFSVVLMSGSVPLAVVAQFLLGFNLGTIYTSSLFYSLHGKPETSEAAIHEAVIGVGIMLGPLISAFAGYCGNRLGFPTMPSIAIAVVTPLLLICGWMLTRISHQPSTTSVNDP